MANKEDKVLGENIPIYGCFSCGTIGGSYKEKTDGLLECGVCGEHTVIDLPHALSVFETLWEYSLLDEYHNIIGNIGGVLYFEEAEDYDPDEYE